MSTKHDLITISQFLVYIDKCGDADIQNTQFIKGIYDTPDVDTRCYVDGMLGNFYIYIQQVIPGWYFITCPGLRMFNNPMTEHTIHKLCSRYKRRVTKDNPIAVNNGVEIDLGYVWQAKPKENPEYADLPENLNGYSYYDERLGTFRVYLYHDPSEKSFILKPSVMLDYIIDDAGLEHAEAKRDVADKLQSLWHEPAADETEPEPEGFWKRILGWFR